MRNKAKTIMGFVIFFAGLLLYSKDVLFGSLVITAGFYIVSKNIGR